MVVDYGTHVIKSVDAGASLVAEDYLDSKYVSANAEQQSKIETEAGFHFFNLLKFEDNKFGIGLKNVDQSSSKVAGKHKNNLVAIDRSGVPLHYVINQNTVPDLPLPTVEKVSESLKKAIQRYYEVNTRPGCVDVSSQNFNFQANVDDASCEGPATNLSFGGVFQQCTQLSSNAEPFVRNWPKRTQTQFSQHLATVSDNCEIFYCAPSMTFTGGELKPVILPPFTKPPQVRMEADNKVMVMTEGEKTWVRLGNDKQWKPAKPEEIVKMLKQIDSDSNKVSAAEKTGVAGLLALMALVAVVAVVIIRRRRKKQSNQIYEQF
ncbi:hypothetical protein WMY93_004537 [Mugilogobius chulae]|uniref:MACPF domain-containing protein n=1 Tax=Mugilogobius chulae TaxID=88201 RepID=A0AAW0PZJ0_9GOBI